MKKLYTDEDGANYLKYRNNSISDYNQSLRATCFLDLGREDYTILDFGCGTGGIVKRIQAARRIGVEIGQSAAGIARLNGVEIYSVLEDVPRKSVDIAISFHAIEHVESPLNILKELKEVVKTGGKIRIVVPCETPISKYHRSWSKNLDRHLYTWTPLLFGNLAEYAGLQDIRTRIEPMPTRSRIVRGLRFAPILSHVAHNLLSLRRNNFNVILDARSPE